MHFGFYRQNLAVIVEQFFKYLQGLLRIWCFVDHIKCQDKIRLVVQSAILGAIQMIINAFCHAMLAGFFPYVCEHFFLNIHSNYKTLRSHHFGHINGEVSGPTSHIDDRIAGLDMGSHNFPGMLNQTSQPIIQKKCKLM